jgi:hypothetical protein
MNALLALAIYAITATKTMASDPLREASYVLGASAVRAERSFSLANRYPVQSVSDVFRDNILLTLSYMEGQVPDARNIDWSAIDKAQSYSFTLNPGEVFAFHEDVLPQFEGKVKKTMRAHFNWDDGFKSDGWLTGDGVCHLASLLYWAAKDAGLATLAPTNHDFANIPEVPREYGVSIYFNPAAPGSSALQNLYITNTFDKPVHFGFTYDGTNLTVKVTD